MCIKFSFKVLLALLLIYSCSRSKYVIYDEALSPTIINLDDQNAKTVLIDYLSCSDCLNEIVNSTSDTVDLKLVFLSRKNKFTTKGVIRKHLELKKKENCNIYFQFSKKKDSYSYSLFNRLFHNYSQQESPVIIVSSKSGVTAYNYNDYIEAFEVDSDYTIEE